MISGNVKFRLQYFDRSVIKTNWKKINEGPLKKAGLKVRRIARQSIRRGGKNKKPSRPGSPPRSQKTGSNPPFKLIFSLPNQFGTSVIVGMVGFTKRGEPVPGLHEHGGTVTRRVFLRQSPDKKGHRRSGRVSEARLKRIRENYARRGQTHQRDTIEKRVQYPERSFMQPALEKAKSKLPELWKGSVK